MSDSKPVSMPPHLWQSLEMMSAEMGVTTDSLVAQAVFTLARLNGYVVPGKALEGARGVPMPSSPSRAPVAGTKARPQHNPPPEPELEPEVPEDEGNPFDESVSGDYSPAPNAADEGFDAGADSEPAPPPAAARSGKAFLTLFVAGRDAFKMTGDTLTIGRGKACEFVIDSNRVSREHVRIIREGPDFVLEDLNSSNGTFYGAAKEKISRRKIKDGDEFTLGTEKVRFQIRK